MAERSGIRPTYWAALALAVAPAWKMGEWAFGSSGPRAVDPRSAAAGDALFRREWTPGDALASGDGLGPVFNARSCAECHFQGGLGGGGSVERNVTVYGLTNGQGPEGVAPAGVVHQQAIRPGLQETLADVHPGLPRQPSIPLASILQGAGTRVSGVQVSQRNTPALFGTGLIDAISDEAIIAHQREHSDAATLVGLNSAKDGRVRGRVARLVDGRVGRFGWKGEFATLGEFVRAACANELGLSNPSRPQPTPLGTPMALGSTSTAGFDLTEAQCEQLTDFCRALGKPDASTPTDPAAKAQVEAGRLAFASVGCADCHSPTLGPVAGIYSDLLLHDMGIDLESAPGAYGEPPVPAPEFAADSRPNSAEWRTPPLWGIADSAPYLHDGRAPTLDEAISLHGGEAQGVANRFKALPPDEQQAILAFLGSLRAPSPQPEAAVMASR